MSRSVLRRAAWCGAALVIVTLAGLSTPAYVHSVAVPCVEQICDQFERPNAAVVELLAGAGISTWTYAVLVVIASWALLLLDLLVATLFVWGSRQTLLSAVTGLAIAARGVTIFGGQFVSLGGSRRPSR